MSHGVKVDALGKVRQFFFIISHNMVLCTGFTVLRPILTHLSDTLPESTFSFSAPPRWFANRKTGSVANNKRGETKGVYNGDVGIITEVSITKKKIRVDFQGLIVDYFDNEFEQLKHAFATTVHKVQGSQYPVVIMVVTTYHSMMLLRNLLYTGVTRAQQRLIIVGDEEVVKYAIRNVKNNTRLSALAEKLTKTA